MKVQYDLDFIKELKKLDVRIRKSFKERIALFSKNLYNKLLNNHALGDPYGGFRSIDITADYRAVYEEVKEEDEIIMYFVILGTHKELYN